MPRHFKRIAERETDDIVAFWEDRWAAQTQSNQDPVLAVWILENPLGEGQFSVRTSTIETFDDEDTVSNSTHITSAETAEAAEEAAIQWMADQAKQ